MRSVVGHLTRNILIAKDNIDWGCRVITSRFMDSSTNKFQNGNTTLSGV